MDVVMQRHVFFDGLGSDVLTGKILKAAYPNEQTDSYESFFHNVQPWPPDIVAFAITTLLAGGYVRPSASSEELAEQMRTNKGVAYRQRFCIVTVMDTVLSGHADCRAVFPSEQGELTGLPPQPSSASATVATSAPVVVQSDAPTAPAKVILPSLAGPDTDLRVRLSRWRYAYESGNRFEANSVMHEVIESIRDANGYLDIESALTQLGETDGDVCRGFEEMFRHQAGHFGLESRTEVQLDRWKLAETELAQQPCDRYGRMRMKIPNQQAIARSILEGLKAHVQSGYVRIVRTQTEARQLRKQLMDQGLVEGGHAGFVIYTWTIAQQELRRACVLGMETLPVVDLPARVASEYP